MRILIRSQPPSLESYGGPGESAAFADPLQAGRLWRARESRIQNMGDDVGI